MQRPQPRTDPLNLYEIRSSDPTLEVRNASGQQVAFNDDFGGSRNSHVTFAPPASGTYYLDVGSFNRTGT